MLAILFTIVFLSCASQITKTQPSQNLTNIPSSRPTTSHDTPTTTAPVQPSKSSQTLEEIELKYDNGEGNILPKNLAMPIVIGECGYLIDFSPLSKPFNIRKIKIFIQRLR